MVCGSASVGPLDTTAGRRVITIPEGLVNLTTTFTGYGVIVPGPAEMQTMARYEVFACDRCGSLVPEDHTRSHSDFHASIDERRS